MSDLLNKASLVMVPSGYKEDTVYSVVPSDGSGDLAFTRASNGTRVNSAGLVEVAPWNLLEYSEDFTNGAWVKTNTTTSANTTTAPNGTTTADSLLETATTGDHRLWERPALIAGEVYSFTIYVKQNGRKRFQVKIFDSSSVQASALFDVSTGTIIATNGTSSIESVGNGWYRCLISATSPTTSTGYCVLDLVTDSFTQSTASDSYAGDTSKGVYIWGAQLNIGSTAKPYFPTTDRLNVPRLTYQNGGGGCPSLLLEKQSTNLCLYSEQFDNAAWTKTNGTITANQAISPDGTQNADKCVVNNGFQVMDMRTASAFSVTTSSVYTWSLYVKKAGYSYCQMTAWTGDDPITVYDLDNGVVVSESGPSHTSTITSVGNGWYRITITRTATDSVAWLRFSPLASATPTDQNGTDGTYIWGAQCEQSTYVTSYIPTTSSSATRVADACYKTGISSLIGQTEGVLFIDLELKAYDSLSKWIGFLGGGSYYIGLYTDGNSRFVAEVYDNNTSFLSQTFTFSVNTRYKMALAYKANDFAFYVNGTQIATDLSGTVPATSDFKFDYNSTAAQLTSRIYNQVALFKTRLTNAELASLTTL